jgi:hypothetical protein
MNRVFVNYMASDLCKDDSQRLLQGIQGENHHHGECLHITSFAHSRACTCHVYAHMHIHTYIYTHTHTNKAFCV